MQRFDNERYCEIVTQFRNDFCDKCPNEALEFCDVPLDKLPTVRCGCPYASDLAGDLLSARLPINGIHVRRSTLVQLVL